MTKFLTTLYFLGSIWGVCSLAIWLGVYFGIWQPYFDTDWRDSECIVQHLEHYQWSYSTKSGLVTQGYVTMNVLVNITNHWVPGFACGTQSSKSVTLGSTSLSGEYPYQPGVCPYPEICGNQVILPIWYCSDCSVCDEKLTGEPTSCKWSVGGEEMDVSPDTWAQGANLPFPVKGGQYIQAVLGTEVSYNEGEFIALHVVGATGGLALLILLAIVCFACIFHKD